MGLNFSPLMDILATLMHTKSHMGKITSSNPKSFTIAPNNMYKDITAVSSFIPFVFTGSSCRKIYSMIVHYSIYFVNTTLIVDLHAEKDFSKMYPIQVDITDLPKIVNFQFGINTFIARS